MPHLRARTRRLRRWPTEVRTAIDRAAVSPVSRAVKDERLTYLSYRSLRNIERCLERLRADAVPGMCIEAGVALGGSAIVIASLMPPGSEFRGYDLFGMIPPPGPLDGARAHERYALITSGRSQGIGGGVYYGYRDDLYEQVCDSFASHDLPVDGKRVSLHRGLFEDTLHLDGEQVAFAHLDCDWYEPVKLCLERIYPVLAPGGYVVSDDYHNYEGATRAVDGFLAARDDMRKQTSRRRPSRTTNLVMRRER